MQVKRVVTYGSGAWTQADRYKTRESTELKKDKKIRTCVKSEKINTEVYSKLKASNTIEKTVIDLKRCRH